MKSQAKVDGGNNTQAAVITCIHRAHTNVHIISSDKKWRRGLAVYCIF